MSQSLWWKLQFQRKDQKIREREQRAERETIKFLEARAVIGAKTTAVASVKPVDTVATIEPKIEKIQPKQDKNMWTKETVRLWVEKYENDYWKQECTVGWVTTELVRIIYAKVRQEGGYRQNTVWYRTNNWWSLHRTMWLVELDWYARADNTNKRPVYKTAIDWIYELTHLIANKYKCTMTWWSVFAYVYGPRAEHMQWRIQHTNWLWANFQRYVKEY